jgi:hypothetical protein
MQEVVDAMSLIHKSDFFIHRVVLRSRMVRPRGFLRFLCALYAFVATLGSPNRAIDRFDESSYSMISASRHEALPHRGSRADF